ncbi:MAG TPA: PQQ-dependent sugar dehydrogenase [Pyrinomonadaceae bacterium]|nr:PQQ-dependent sugar dehydrogenase [Pyrinomonadaceae bacterium]
MYRIKILALILFAAFAATLLLTDNAANPHARAFSAGPPAGYTHAPGELDCSDCHTSPTSSAGTLTLGLPPKYTPGQTYDVTVTHATQDPTRVRWGFEMTALDSADQKAGSFAPSDDLVRVVNGEGPFPNREYVEHTSNGTFSGRQNGAAWTFKWTAPSQDVGPVTFFLAGNQANGDGNSSGDNIFFTFQAVTFEPPSPDFQVTFNPSARTVVRGSNTSYDITVTPLNGFTGTVNLNVPAVPQGTGVAYATVVNITDSSPRTAALNLGTSADAPTGAQTFAVNATSGSLSHTAQATLNVVASSDVDLSVSQTVSPNPAQTNSDIKYTITVTNNGPATPSSNVELFVGLPSTISPSFTEGAGGEVCSLGPAGLGLTYTCRFAALAPGESRTIDFTIRTALAGVLTSETIVHSAAHDPFPSNDKITLALPVAPSAEGPSMTVSNLGVRTVVKGLDQPTSMAFLGAGDFLVLEKASGRVLRVRNGVVQGAVLDLAVNSASERGLLGMALHPNFASNGFAYLFWTESSTGADTTAIDEVPLLGNRVDRFHWDGTRLNFDRTLQRFRALQTDAGQPSRGNHNGGVLRFGPDGKLYVLMGDNGRRGFMQNLPCGPSADCNNLAVTDDQFGGPEPDDAHLTGVVLRLNDDGTTPTDNPYSNIQPFQTTQASTNIKKVFAYGVRNGFGMDFDPVGGSLWTQENGDDAFDEINRVESGFNGGWIQLMGPSSRVAEFKSIEVARGNSLQQNRWPPSNTADTPAAALARLFNLPGSHYTEPEFSWKYAVAPSPVGFVRGDALGAQYAGDLFVGASRTTLLGGYLFRLKLSADRKTVAANDSRLADKVADNSDKFDISESESLVVGRDFGITTDIQTAPAGGGVYVVSLSDGAVYEVFARPSLFVANLDGAQETPPHDTAARGAATLLLDADEKSALVSLHFRDLSSAQTDAHIHGPAAAGESAPPVFDLPDGQFDNFPVTLTPQQVSDLKAGLFYVNVHSQNFPAGEIRGQLGAAGQPSAVQLDASDASVSEGTAARLKTVRVRRLGDTSSPATVDYATSDGTATERGDYTTTRGTLRFAAGEAEKTFDVLITDDALQESDETFNVTLSNPIGPLAVADPAAVPFTIRDDDQGTPRPNPIDSSEFFVRRHYHDFLNREADAPGLAFWTYEIESCGANQQCRDVKRIHVSAAFFLSTEFQETGYFLFRLYLASLGREPLYAEFIGGVQELSRGVIVGQGDWRARLEANRAAFVEEWVKRRDYRGSFDGISNATFVERLFFRAGLGSETADQNALLAALNAGTKTRTQVLVELVELPAMRQRHFTAAFVLMEYFGYLRRNPSDPPNVDLSGYNFWRAKLEQFNGDFVKAEMVKAFISSDEYRHRFGP